MKIPGNLHILIAEDDDNTRKTIRVMLKELGITQIFEAADGESASQFLKTNLNTLDLVISDWNMPNKSGFEFLQDLRESHPHVPFLMVSARADEHSVIDARKAGVSGYLRKPFTLNELQNKIFSLLH